jgi:hypothetical protein
MHLPDTPLLVALVTLVAAASITLVADQPPRNWGRAWLFALMVVLTATVNLGLSVTMVTAPDSRTGLTVLASALLLTYAVRRRLGVVADGRRPPRR